MEFDLSHEDKEILFEFITESNESLGGSELILLALEDEIANSAQVDPANIDKIFRTFHSIKGSAGFIGLKELSRLTHHAETLLDNIRKGKLALAKPHIDIFLEVCDVLQMMMEHLQNNLTEAGMDLDLDELIERMEALTNGDLPAEEAGEEPEAPPAKSAPAPQPAPAPVSAASAASPGDELINQEMVNQYITEATEMLDSLEQDLLALEKDPGSQELIENAFRLLHSLKGNSGFFNYQDIQAICHTAESFLDNVRNGQVVANSKQISLILQVLDFIRQAVESLAKGKAPLIPGKAGLIDLMKDMFGIEEPEEEEDEEPEPAAKPAPPKAAAKPEPEPEPELTFAEPEPEIEEEIPQPVMEKPAPRAASAPLADLPAIPEIEKRLPQARKSQDSKNTNEVIRVDVSKLNQLMDLVGEIVIAESMVSQNPDLEGMELGNFEKSIGILQKNVRDLQELATAMRMIPLSGLFGKMRRLVRDISGKNHKQVDFEVLGGETEVDRTVIENISDPLVHILRNSLDHGIEKPDERTAKGKSATGKVLLEAKRVGGEIWIVIDDDGAGLNREKILKKALEKGLVQENEELNDSQVYNLIFTPGFSTAAQVTSISGRGVGMDVVLRNIEKIRGRVDVASEEGKGTRIVLRIPLTTAIIDGMLMQVEGALYAIPTLDIKESLQVDKNNVVDLIDGQEVINIRDTIIPVLRLQEMHQIDSRQKGLDEGIVVVAENGGKAVGFLVDEILGQQQLVIKPLSDYLGNISGVSGCSVLGNGDICLILDLASMVKVAENNGVAV